MLDALAASAAPRDRALASQMDWLKQGSTDPTSSEHASRGALLRGAAKSAPDDALVQWFWANANEQDSGCSTADPCPDRAHALARLQPDNGAAWMPVFDAASKAHDAAAADTALGRMAMATRWDGVFGESLKAWMEVYARYPVPPNEPADAMKLDQQGRNFEMAMAASAAIAIPRYHPLVDACTREKMPTVAAVRSNDCAMIGRLMMNHGNDQLTRLIGRPVLRGSGQYTKGDLIAARDFMWLTEQRYKLSAAHAKDQDWFKDDMPVWLATWDEMAVTRSELQRAGIALSPPADWQPRGRDGKPISPLGEPPSKHGSP